MSLLNKPNLLSGIILGAVVLIAGSYGLVTYTQAPDLEHYKVDPTYGFAFNFDRPTVTKLPEELVEISGLSPWIKEGELLSVQDEDGKIFIVNAKTGKITNDFKFGKDRDYEGIARKGNSIFVLERDGDIHHVEYQEGVKEFDANKLETAFSYRNDTEGICYDSETGNLLIVPKEQELNPAESEPSRHGVYSYNLESGDMMPQPSYFIDEFAVGEVVYGKHKPFHLKPSGVAVDPITKDIYVIASVGNILVVINRESEIKQIELLKEKTFKQPEGICFDTQGNLYISSEGRGGKGVIASFTRKGGGSTKNRTDE